MTVSVSDSGYVAVSKFNVFCARYKKYDLNSLKLVMAVNLGFINESITVLY